MVHLLASLFWQREGQREGGVGGGAEQVHEGTDLWKELRSKRDARVVPRCLSDRQLGAVCGWLHRLDNTVA